MKIIGFNNFTPAQVDGQPAVNIDMSFDGENCGCVPDPTDTKKVRWVDIEGRPECILDCNTLQQYIALYGLTNLGNSDEITVEADVNGIVRAYLVPRGAAGTFGSASKTVRMTLNDKGIVTSIEEVNIAIGANQVTYTNTGDPAVTTVKEALDNLYAFFVRQAFEHTQMTPATTWTINHNLGRKPTWTILDADGDLAFGKPAYPSNNQLVFTFSEPIAGKAYLT